MRLSPMQYKQQFLVSDIAEEIKQQLALMEESPGYHTRTSYSPSKAEETSFTDTHIEYLSKHPNVKPSEYMSNLRLKTKLR